MKVKNKSLQDKQTITNIALSHVKAAKWKKTQYQGFLVYQNTLLYWVRFETFSHFCGKKPKLRISENKLALGGV